MNASHFMPDLAITPSKFNSEWSETAQLFGFDGFFKGHSGINMPFSYFWDRFKYLAHVFP